jgi:hypothetical protein
MIHKLVTSKAVIAKVIADLGLEEDDIKISDIKEWISEAINKIGSVNQLDHKVITVPLNSFQVKLPCDLYRLDSVAYSTCEHGGWVPMRKATGSFSVYGNKHKEHNKPEMIVQDKDLYQIVKNMYNLVKDEDAAKKLEDINLRQTLSCLINHHTIPSVNGNLQHTHMQTNMSMYPQYDTKPGYIFTNVPEGFLKISYFAQYSDEDGMLLIPDMPSYFEAAYWYVAMKLLYIEYIKGNKPQNIYYDAKRSWNFYCRQAYADSLMPNTDEITSISNAWHTIVPEISEHETFYSTTGDRHTTYNFDR